MAKHTGKGRRRKGRPIKKIVLRDEMDITALALETAQIGALQGAASRDYYAVSADISVSVSNAVANEGPVEVYLAHSDYTIVEIKEYITLQTGFDQGDQRSQEIQRRKIRFAGTLAWDNLTQGQLNEGELLRVKLRFLINEDKTLNLVIYNSSATLTTQATIVRTHGSLWGRWA